MYLVLCVQKQFYEGVHGSHQVTRGAHGTKAHYSDAICRCCQQINDRGLVCVCEYVVTAWNVGVYVTCRH